jgi:hypothetical protein
MNELEFLQGDTSTKYGALRASLGYPKPWKVNFVEIGNEDNLNGGPSSYNSYRFKMFYDAVKAKYPNMTILASFETKTLPGDAGMDYHTYNQPNKMIGDFGKFDRYDRKHKVIVGMFKPCELHWSYCHGANTLKGSMPTSTKTPLETSGLIVHCSHGGEAPWQKRSSPLALRGMATSLSD